MMESLYTSVRVRLFLSDCTAAKTNELGVVSMLQAVLLFALGLVLLIKGGDWFVDGATGVARRFKLPDIIVGATVVSIGTTLPEVMVSVTGALQGQGAMAYGNAIGSLRKGHASLGIGNVIGANIFNLVLVSGASVALAPFTVPVGNMLFGINSSLVLDMPLMVIVMALLCVPALMKKKLGRWQGITLLCIYAAFCACQFML